MAGPSIIARVKAAAKGFVSAGQMTNAKALGVPPMSKRGYNAANYDRLTMDWSAPLTTGDAEMRTRIRTLRGRARELERNEPYTRRFLTCLENNIYDHHGIMLQSKAADIKGRDPVTKEVKWVPDNADISIIECAWKEWCKNPYVSGDRTFNEGGRLTLRTMARDGDPLVKFIVDPSINKFGFAIQALEPDMIDDYRNEMIPGTPNGQPQKQIRMGVEVDPYMKQIAYWLLKEHPGDQMWWNSDGYVSDRHPAADFIHLFKATRWTQVRDVSWLVGIMRDLRMLDGYDEAAIVAARVGAAKMGFLVQKNPEGNPYDGAKDMDGNLITDAEAGAMEQLPFGMEFQSFNPEYPSAAYDPFVKSRVRRIGAGLNMSYYTLANDLTEVNFSSIRAGILDDREQYKALQTFWIDRHETPIFDKWLQYSLLMGALKDPLSGLSLPFSKISKFSRHEFRPRRWPWVDPLKDVQADTLAINNRLTTRGRVIAENSQDDYEEIIRDTAQEEAYAKQNNVVLPSPDVLPSEVMKGGDQAPPAPDAAPKPKGGNGKPAKAADGAGG